MRFRGDDPLSMGQMPGLLDTLGDMDDLEHLLRQATQPGELAEVDLDRARELLGDDAARSLERLAELAKMLEEAGLIEQREGRLELTPAGHPRASASKALGDLFRKLMKDRAGRHEQRARRRRARPRVRAQALRVGRPVPPRRRADGEERDLASGRGHAGAAHARRLRDRAHRAASRAARRCCCSTCRCRCRCATTSCRRRRSRWRCTRSSRAVPARLLRARELRSRRARGAAGAAPRDELGLRVGHEHAARAAARPARCSAARAARKQIIMVTDGEPTAHIERRRGRTSSTRRRR